MNISTYTSVPTYSKLVEVVKVYLNRYDDATVNMIPFFINAAEKTILRNARMPSMEKMVSFTIAESAEEDDGVPYIQLPLDYLEMKFVWIKGKTLHRISFDQIIDESEDGSLTNTDATWSINANRMYISGVSREDDIFMTYYSDIPEISANTQSNVLLDLLPDAFLYFSVAEGFRFLMEEQKSDYWTNQAYARLNEIKQQVEDAEFSGSPLAIRGL